MNDRNESDLTIPYVKVRDYYFPKSNVTFIAQLMGISQGALAGAFLAPFLYGLYWKRTSRIAVWTSFIFSSVAILIVSLATQSHAEGPEKLWESLNGKFWNEVKGTEEKEHILSQN